MNQRTRQELHVLLIFGLLIVSLGMGPVSPAVASGEPGPSAQAGSAGIDGFHLVSVDQGWVLTGNQLYWTANGGSTWVSITPPLPGKATIAAVDFIDSREGRVLMVDAAGADPIYSLGVTHDGGTTWETAVLDLFAAGDVSAVPDKAYMQWLSPQTGWLVIKRATGINFSVGSLFRTDDGGLTWIKLSIPVGEPVEFVTSLTGWVAGGAAGDELYRTLDGGATWISQAFVQAAGSPTRRLAYLPPRFQDANNGLLPVMVSDGNSASMDFYSTADGGGAWTLVNSTALDENVDLSVRAALTMFDVSHFTMLVPGSNRIVTEQGSNQFTTSHNLDSRSGDLTSIEMASMQEGLGLFTAGKCVGQAASVPPPSNGNTKQNLTCTQTQQLLKTTDGGATWTPVILPGLTGANLTGDGSLAGANGPLANVSYRQEDSYSYDTMIGQGVDICELPSAAKMLAWWTDSPYGAVNLYIGGSMRACSNSLLTPTLVSALFGQGWKFIPTWVGPQAPCTTFHDRVSLDPVTARAQGVTEADAAAATASALGLSNPDGSNTVIYYDLESYNTGDTSCRIAMKLFMDGWDAELAAKGNASGVYGSACTSGLTDFAGIAHVPDSIWVAWWNKSTYTPAASVFGIVCLANTYWPYHQRIHQYTGDHNETWGGITINIDDNVMDGMLAVPYAGSGSGAPSQPATPKPVDMAILSWSNDTWLYWSTNGSSCNVHIWGVSIDTTTNGNCASQHLGLQAPGVYYWQVTAINANGSTLGPVWHFNIKPYSIFLPLVTR
jgi:photosystem II stability/assembly factor-like uncharacterized protein